MNFQTTSRITRWDRLLFLSRNRCSHYLLPQYKYFSQFFLLGLFAVFFAASAQALELQSDVKVATAGFFQLSWSGETGTFQLQESASAEFDSFETIYQGGDLARVVSGKPNGEYFYRIRALDGNNSLTSRLVKVEVAHHSLQTASWFFSAGAFVFISILIFILIGNRRTT